MEKRGLFAYAYTKESSPATDSIKLVEWRVERGVSDEPEEDLTRLIEHYQNTFQWHKANAASRQILALANGESAKFQVLPEDHEVQEARLRLFRYKLNHQAFPLSIAAVGFIFVVLAAQSQLMNRNYSYSYQQQHHQHHHHHQRFTQAELMEQTKFAPGFLEEVKAKFFSSDIEPRLARARYRYHRQQFFEAMQEIEAVLAQHPNSSDANELKAMILRDADELAAALKTVEKVERYAGYYQVRGSILFRLGRLAESADMAEAHASIACGDPGSNFLDASVNRRYASQYSQALALARKGTALAESEAVKARGFAFQAFLLSDPDSSILAATNAIHIYQTLPEKRKGNLTGFEQSCLSDAFEAYLHRANAHLKKGDKVAALKDVSIYLTRQRWQSGVFQLRASIYDDLGLKDKAKLDRRRSELIMDKAFEYAFKVKATPEQLGKETVYVPL